MAGSEKVSLDSLLERALAESDVALPRDAVLIALHSSLLSVGFVCVATGDKDFEGKAFKTSEAISTALFPKLPSGWNSLQDECSLQYRHEQTKQVCLVKAIPMGAHLLINAVVASHVDMVISLNLLPSKYVKDGVAYNSLSVYSNLLDLMSTLKSEIELKLTQTCKESAPRGGQISGQSQSAPSLSSGPKSAPDDNQHFPPPIDPLKAGPSSRPDHPGIPDPLRIGPPRRPGVGGPDPLDPFSEVGPFGYGDRDRFPLGGGGRHGGGGMIYDPRHGGGGLPGMGVGPRGPFPPGHPPGARFDPISPLGPSIRPPRPRPGQIPRNPPDAAAQYGPDPDHLPPPGYDDMFS